ncbi:hypothetical protein [Streptomyces sp. NBC_00198]|uniref:hypothetical protein n=1 Tax=Streptomyces sp. NBC_00198 TaxID=2975677 RepID=UPI0022548249|nr:hypothetical protein [Streptomyces sp. NBC_00198]MCX5281883.1 hypothetical protein [Streptomyces sp. NBC_00198]
MTIAQHLATIDRLCSEEFPAEHGRSADGTAGPGYHVAELVTSGDFWDTDGATSAETEEQFEAERDGLSQLLTRRWGPPQCVSLASVLERSTSGEDIPEPWGDLSSRVPDLHLWRPDGCERWIALGIGRWGRELPFQLLALVTVTDPP